MAIAIPVRIEENRKFPIVGKEIHFWNKGDVPVEIDSFWILDPGDFHTWNVLDEPYDQIVKIRFTRPGISLLQILTFE